MVCWELVVLFEWCCGDEWFCLCWYRVYWEMSGFVDRLCWRKFCHHIDNVCFPLCLGHPPPRPLSPPPTKFLTRYWQMDFSVLLSFLSSRMDHLSSFWCSESRVSTILCLFVLVLSGFGVSLLFLQLFLPCVQFSCGTEWEKSRLELVSSAVTPNLRTIGMTLVQAN